MTKFEVTNEEYPEINRLPAQDTHIFVGRLDKSTYMWIESFKKEIHWSKYQIKETDPRVKTATFSSPNMIDLTLGVFAVLISSPYHENFIGIILSVEYDEKNHMYNYQCQDWSRKYMNRIDYNLLGQPTIYEALRNIITNGGVSILNPTQAQLDEYKTVLSGLRPAEDYNQEDWGSIIKFNAMTEKPMMLIRNKLEMDIIRDFVYGKGMYIDIWFNSNGIMQLEPYQKEDFFNTGLHLSRVNASDEKFKFDLTNLVTGVEVTSNDRAEQGEFYINDTLVTFFGKHYGNISNPNQSTDSSVKSAGSAPTTKNPFNDKDKKIMICADGGDTGFKDEIKKLLKNDGWSVTDLGIGPDKHSKSYNQINSSYAVNLVIANGFFFFFVRECITGWLKGHHEKMGVAFVQMWDTHNWTNPNGMKPYRYGDFTGYSAGRAWDDNFSSSDPSIKDVMKYFKDNKVLYCCGPTSQEAYEQFKMGGYLRMKGLM